MVVNASPIGMSPGDGLPAAIEFLDPETLVGDVVISDAPTPLMQLAMRYGCPFVDGRDMHSGQVDALLAFFSFAAAPHIDAPAAPLHAVSNALGS